VIETVIWKRFALATALASAACELGIHIESWQVQEYLNGNSGMLRGEELRIVKQVYTQAVMAKTTYYTQ